jgi:hypothetical protein
MSNITIVYEENNARNLVGYLHELFTDVLLA